MPETFEQFVARVNAYGYLPTKDDPMAQIVKLKKNQSFNFATKSQSSKYPWDEWFTGDLLMLQQSEGTKDEKGTVTVVSERRDYEVATDFMPAKLKTAARRRYKICLLSRRDAEGNRLKDALIIQARPMTDEEKVAEDTLRAEEREKLKAKLLAARSNNGAAPTAEEVAEAEAEEAAA